MPDWVWIAGGVVLVLVALAAALVALARHLERLNALETREAMEHGQEFVAYVLHAPDELYRPGTSAGATCRVLIAFEPESPELHSALRSLVARLVELRRRGPRMRAEIEATKLVKHEGFLPGRVVVPSGLTGGRTVYCYDMYIDRPLLPEGHLVLLPEGHLVRPYVHCKAVPGAKGIVCMIPYPSTKPLWDTGT